MSLGSVSDSVDGMSSVNLPVQENQQPASNLGVSDMSGSAAAGSKSGLVPFVMLFSPPMRIVVLLYLAHHELESELIDIIIIKIIIPILIPIPILILIIIIVIMMFYHLIISTTIIVIIIITIMIIMGAGRYADRTSLQESHY